MQNFTVQIRTNEPDGIGGFENVWNDISSMSGYLDFSAGTDQNVVQNADTEGSTHILIVPRMAGVNLSNKMRLVGIDERIYYILYVDNPMGMNHHLEVYLRYGE